ncbi:MAG: malate synthase, partial [Halobacteriota archaeon]
MSTPASSDRAFVRTFFTSPTAIDDEDSAKMLRKAAQLRGMQAPDVWVPDHEDATAPSMRWTGVENTIEVVAEQGADFPGEIHPRVVWHREDPGTRHMGFEMMMELADPDNGAGEYIDGFVVPEVGDVDDWKKADECLTIVEHEHGLEEGRLSMSVIVESAQAELALGELRHEAAKPTNNLERLFMLVDGEVDYTKDMRAITPSGQLPPWPELRHNTSRGASANGLIAVDGPFDDIRNVEGYHARMTENQAKGQLGIWSLTPGQVVEANQSPLPPVTGSWRLAVAGEDVDLREADGESVYDGDDLAIEESGDGYRLREGNRERSLDHEELVEELVDRATYLPSMTDIVESMEAFEAAKEAGRGAIAMAQETTVRVGDVAVDISADRMWDEATYQAAQTPISLFQDVYENRPDQHDDLA